MGPELGVALAAGITGGVTVVKVFERFWPQNGNGKVEMLLGRLVDLAEEDQKNRNKLTTTLALMQKSIEDHAKAEAEAWKDAFKLLRKET